MIQETQDLFTTLERLTGQIVDIISGAPLGFLDWRPGPETNSAAAIVTHTLGASRHWLVAIVAGGQSDRNRDAEFQAEAAQIGAVERRAQQWLADARQVLDSLSVEQLDQRSQRVRATTFASAAEREAMTARGAILHVIEHLGTHIGHLELTVQLYAQLEPKAGS